MMGPRSKETTFFLFAHLALLCIVLAGFARTFYLRGLFVPRPLPLLLQLHGIALTLWFAVVVIQGLLMSGRRRAWHRRLAWLTLPVIVAVIVSGAWVNLRLALQLSSASDPENMFIWANFTSLLSFAILLAAAVKRRHRPPAHHRLIFFASLSIIGPAFARFAFWPVVGLGLGMAPIFAMAGMLLLVILAIAYDLATLGRVERATWGGLAGVFVPLIGGMAVAVSGLGYALLNA
ncbi:hypothetical protein [Duganella callida]|uniref:DUF2306 domain-containing protein n=1 Tax=Duganella callida TaxID=2561932 RepID=A0A4Y9S7G6_9BURK|nr:hypothetical protein [Duganella callida]TFW15667.1 hypothetical protein E4L98_25890 [Duganella callida]